MPPGRAPGAPPVRIAAELLRRMVSICEAGPDRESCGFLVRRAGALEVVPIPNAADRYHAADPATFPRTARDGFLMDPRAQLRVHRDLERSGGEIVAVWHSHVDAGAHLSAKDRSDALVDGVAQVPGADHVVLGMRAGKVTDARRWRLEGSAFVEVGLDDGAAPAGRGREER